MTDDESLDELAALSRQAYKLESRGFYRDAAACQHRCVALTVGLYGSRSQNTLNAMVRLGYLHRHGDQFAACRHWYERVLETGVPLLGEGHELIRLTCSNMGALMSRWGQYDEAIAFFHRALGPVLRQDAIPAASLMHVANIATSWWCKGRRDIAEPLYRMAYSLAEDHFGVSDWDKAYICKRLGQLLSEYRPRADTEAEQWLARSCDCLGIGIDRDHPEWSEEIGTLAEVRARRGDHSLLESSLRMLEVMTDKLGRDHHETARHGLSAGRALISAGRLDEAEDILRNASQVLAASLGRKHLLYLRCIGSLGETLLAKGSDQQAHPLLTEAIDEMSAHHGMSHPWLAEPLEAMATYLSRRGDSRAAANLWARARAVAALAERTDDFAHHAKRLLDEGTYLESALLCYGAMSQVAGPGHPTRLVELHELRADGCQAMGWWKAALRSRQLAERICLDMGDYPRLAKNLRVRARLIAHRQSPDAAKVERLLAQAKVIETRGRYQSGNEEREIAE